jgi:hypothetical protein
VETNWSVERADEKRDEVSDIHIVDEIIRGRARMR